MNEDNCNENEHDDNEQAFSNYRDLFYRFYDEFERHENIFRHNDNIFSAFSIGKEYAQMGIKYLFWANGGALIAMPAILQAFDMSKNEHVYSSAGFYSAGLVFVIVTILFAFKAMVTRGTALKYWRNSDYAKFALRHLEERLSNEARDRFYKEKEQNIENYEKKNRGATTQEWWSFFFAVLGILSFIAGNISFLLSVN